MGDAGSLHRASTDTRVSTLAPSDDDMRAHSTDTPFTDPSSSSAPVSKAHASVDGFLHPPSSQPGRAQRRNTTGSAHQLGRQHQDGEISSGDIEDDIEHQAAQIRKERARAKAAAEAEAALTRRMSEGEQRVAAQGASAGAMGPDGLPVQRNREARVSRGEKTEGVLVGNLIGEDHVNYVMMYNMLTGIRIAVSRCQAKIKRPLSTEDFTAKHKYSFDIVGNELTPSAKYDFKFKDYAPWVFRELREDYFGLDPADYLLSLTAKYILSELGSPGKSGSFFYFSRDYRFIIKTIHHSEHKFLLSILPQYHAHIKNNPHTLVSRFYGLHRVKLPRGRKIHFVIMNNLFPPHKDIHETFDLKGSTVGREYPEAKMEANPRAVMKDLNWINRQKQLELGPEKRALLTAQLERDAEMLKAVKVMDYSLLVGIHYMKRGNRENVRTKTLKVFDPAVPMMRRKTTMYHKGGRSPEALAMRLAMGSSDPKRLTEDALVDKGTGSQFIFYQDEGGLRATDEENSDALDMIYYLGVIDILTPYHTKKSLEHFWKGLSADRHKISPVPPSEYGDRFFSFMKAIMRGGGGGERFKPDYKPETELQSQVHTQPEVEPTPQ
ncbi:SAICAR synthase-like protein [Coniophora puteana RWD-64-598 SS2]|uniref:1-phosphatidylinositol-4-phosphate 5-kinase n=1 Tax=Coniophora puteana (strain RWD-64-598) TaxID=741705 RepID=A0A5M3MG45_CONPW|nr:SAICAR synthase-like protein [Coniophora puteana RWD-64-598 SS2]EIW78218.1 SAICAR synthase-like protein [Coniophora puteana RWD-64-598 SS2]